MIYLGSDHAGFSMKQEVKTILQELGLEFQDLGNLVEDAQDDYPEYAFAVGEAVAKEPGAFGLIVCGTGEGVCIAANKVKGVRAVPVRNIEDAARAREHNDANVLCLSGWNQSIVDIKPIIKTFFSTPFTGEPRHVRRIGKITAYEGK
jgi:ribose 5-phosphate isomerase B